jgi:hypothetical protein
MKTTHWARILTYVSGLVNQELLLRNEYLAAENRILRAHIEGRLRLSDPERATLAEVGKRLGRKALEQIACVAKPDTILGWYRKLVAQKFDALIRVALESAERLRNSSFVLRRRIPVGGMTELWVHWRTSATASPIRP